MTYKYHPKAKCVECGKHFGNHRFSDDRCWVNGEWALAMFRPEEGVRTIPTHLQQQMHWNKLPGFWALPQTSSSPTIEGTLNKMEKALGMVPAQEIKRPPLPGWGKRTPFDPFKGFIVDSSRYDPDCFPQGHPFQRFTTGDKPWRG